MTIVKLTLKQECKSMRDVHWVVVDGWWQDDFPGYTHVVLTELSFLCSHIRSMWNLRSPLAM